MQGRKSGYFLVYRDVWKHKVFRSLIESSVWLYMISSASHQEKTLNFLNSRIFVKVYLKIHNQIFIKFKV